MKIWRLIECRAETEHASDIRDGFAYETDENSREIARYATKTEAMAALMGYASKWWRIPGAYCATEYMIEEVEVDEDGDFIETIGADGTQLEIKVTDFNGTVVGSFDTLVEAQRFADRYADDEYGYGVEESK